MSFPKIRTLLISGLVAIWSLGTAQAQTINVNNQPCAGATVTFGSGTININTSNCAAPVATAPTITSGAPPSGNVNVGYSFSFAASGSTPITWTATGLPAGLSLSSAGALAGTPTAQGSFPIVVTAANGTSPNATGNYTLTIANTPAITSAVPAVATPGVAYSHTFVASQTATWSVTSGTLPGWVLLNPTTGVLSGTPAAGAADVANTMLTITATNANGTASQAFTLSVVGLSAPAFTSGVPPAAGAVGTAYTSFTFAASGSPAPTFAVVSGDTLPPGLALSSTGVLSGTPTAGGTFTFAVQATNSQGSALSPATGKHSVVIASGGGILSIENALIPSPSKQPASYGAFHGGANGAGAYQNAWAIDPAACNSPTATPATKPAITRLWLHNVDFNNYLAQAGSDLFDMAPNEALMYRFTTTSGSGSVNVGETTNGPYVAMFMSISQKPCDFDPPKLISSPKDFCYATSANQFSINFEVTTGAVGWGTCKLEPNKVYYLNMRFQEGRAPAYGGTAADSCTVSNSARCAGLFQLTR